MILSVRINYGLTTPILNLVAKKVLWQELLRQPRFLRQQFHKTEKRWSLYPLGRGISPASVPVHNVFLKELTI